MEFSTKYIPKQQMTTITLLLKNNPIIHPTSNNYPALFNKFDKSAKKSSSKNNITKRNPKPS